MTGNIVGQTSASDPLELFAAGMPVYEHPRCANCHGGTDPANGDNHAGGAIKSVPDPQVMVLAGQPQDNACFACHDEGVTRVSTPGVSPEQDPLGVGSPSTSKISGPWQLAPGEMSFAGRDAKALCMQLVMLNGLNTGDPAALDSFENHIAIDPRIGMAFEGKRGITDKSPDGPVEAAPPDMTRDEFHAVVDRWLKEGQARCGTGWNGTLFVNTSTHATQSEPLPAGCNGTHTIEDQSSDVVTISITGDVGLAHREINKKTIDISKGDCPALGGFGSCHAGPPQGRAPVDQSAVDQTTGGTTAQVAVQVAIDETDNTFGISAETPNPPLTTTHTESSTRLGCDGPMTVGPTTTSTTSPGGEPFYLGSTNASGTFDPKQPDLLAGSTGPDEMGTTVHWRLAEQN